MAHTSTCGCCFRPASWYPQMPRLNLPDNNTCDNVNNGEFAKPRENAQLWRSSGSYWSQVSSASDPYPMISASLWAGSRHRTQVAREARPPLVSEPSGRRYLVPNFTGGSGEFGTPPGTSSPAGFRWADFGLGIGAPWLGQA